MDVSYRVVANLAYLSRKTSDLTEITPPHRRAQQELCERLRKSTSPNPPGVFHTRQGQPADTRRNTSPTCWACGGPHLKAVSREGDWKLCKDYYMSTGISFNQPKPPCQPHAITSPDISTETENAKHIGFPAFLTTYPITLHPARAP
eukprot:scaffold28647_cov19-Prasinocladus_malaysianus.AAC.3